MTEQRRRPDYAPPVDPPTGPIRMGPPPPLAGARGTNTMAILSVVFAVVFSPLGVVFGIVGRRQTRRTGQPGRGLATTGLWLSIAFLVLTVAAVLYVVVLAAWLVGTTPTVVPGAPTPPTVQIAPSPAGTATVGVTGGDYGPEVPSDALAAQVDAQSGATDVVCPGYLPAQVDASTICSGTVDGQQAQLQTHVTAVEGSSATVDITRVG